MPATASPASSELCLALAELLTRELRLAPGSFECGRETALLGALPELDSMAVVAVLTAIESRFTLVLDDAGLSASSFATLGSLADFVASQRRS
jgi:acyl carrier protein